MQQGLHDHAVTLGALTQYLDLLRSGLGSVDLEGDVDRVEPHRHLPGHAQRTAEIEFASRGDAYPLHRDPHGGGHHLGGDLRAGGQSPQQQVPRASSRAGASDTQMGLGLADLPRNRDRAGHGSVSLMAMGLQSNTRRVGRAPVLLLERFLQLANIHASSIGCWAA